VADGARAVCDGQSSSGRDSVSLVAQGNGCWSRAISGVAAHDLSSVDGTGRDGSRLGGVPGRWDDISGWRRRSNISG
jgi:hypothetical protein